MPKGKRGPTPDALDEPLDEQQPLYVRPDPPIQYTGYESEQLVVEPNENEDDDLRKVDAGRIDVYHCEHDGCDVSGTYEEWLEHSDTTGHSHYLKKPIEYQQPALFPNEPVKVSRYLNVPVSESFLNEARLNMQRVVREIISVEDEKKAFDSECNERLKPLKEQLRGLDSTLHRTFEQKQIECEWRVSTEENARILTRLDTNEIIERQPLTAEDRVAELDAIVISNTAEAPEPEDEPEDPEAA